MGYFVSLRGKISRCMHLWSRALMLYPYNNCMLALHHSLPFNYFHMSIREICAQVLSTLLRWHAEDPPSDAGMRLNFSSQFSALTSSVHSISLKLCYTCTGEQRWVACNSHSFPHLSSERTRNLIVCTDFQKNRNPFIDYPGSSS